MSEQKLISPLLDGFTVGKPTASHNGIRCYPAVKESSNEKFIVKMISVPASQVQLEALLLTGAYHTTADATDYFKSLADDITREAEVLQTLSKLEGFLPFESWQTVPMENGNTGFHVCLLAPYRRTLARYLRKNPVTHLQAVNLALDLCAALAICRRAGFVYADLKPENIAIVKGKGYRICDLGFVDQASLKFTSLPGKYRSPYSPPEVLNDFNTLNETIDTYAVGMILYQIYNEGILPTTGTGEPIPSPANADYEIGEIILKAIAPEPENRWNNPMDMGKALVSYMQRNSVNNTPITPPSGNLVTDPEPVAPAPEPEELPAPEETADASEPVSEEISAPEAQEPEDAAAETPEAPAQEEALVTDQTIVIPAAGLSDKKEKSAGPVSDETIKIPLKGTTSSGKTEASSAGETIKLPVSRIADGETPAAPATGETIKLPVSRIADTKVPAASATGETIKFPVSPIADTVVPSSAATGETIKLPVSQDAETPKKEIPSTGETVRLPVKEAAAQAPAEPMDQTQIFSAILSSEGEDEDDFDFNLEEFISDLNMEPESDQTEEVKETESESQPRPRKERKPPKSAGGWIIGVILVLILLVLGYCGFLFYNHFYLFPIDDLTVEGTKNELIVTVDTREDYSLLQVSCTDSYGSSIIQSFVDGQAVFTDLLPGSLYRVELKLDGFHKLTGKTSDIFTTDALTNIVNFNAVAGAEDGAVMLNFTVDGSEPDQWTVICSAEGEEDVIKAFTGHSVTVKGLTTGKLYTLTLDAGEHTELTGTYSLEHIPSKLILAENLHVADIVDNTMTVRWDTPANTIVETWSVRCYNDSGFEALQEVTSTEAVFLDVDTSAEYTIEVTAAGMTQPARVSITANPIIITDFKVTAEDMQLNISWEHEGEIPEGGWLLLYSVDGKDNQQSIVKCEGTTAVLNPRIPGASYRFSLQAADSTTIFNSTHTYNCPNAEIFSANGLSADKITAVLLKTPENPDWTYESVGDDAFTDIFTVGDDISMVLKATANFYIPSQTFSVLYVIRDENGNVVLDCISQSAEDWKDLWYSGDYHCGELNIPTVPNDTGKYTVSIYFDGKAVTATNFTIQE